MYLIELLLLLELLYDCGLEDYVKLYKSNLK